MLYRAQLRILGEAGHHASLFCTGKVPESFAGEDRQMQAGKLQPEGGFETMEYLPRPVRWEYFAH